MPRPKPVNGAMVCIIASYAISTIQMLKDGHLSNLDKVNQVIGVSLAESAIVLGIYYGKNRVRWLFVASIVIWLAFLVLSRLSGHGFRGVDLLLLTLNFTLYIASVILLFYPESNDWFRKRPVCANAEPQVKG